MKENKRAKFAAKIKKWKVTNLGVSINCEQETKFYYTSILPAFQVNDL